MVKTRLICAILLFAGISQINGDESIARHKNSILTNSVTAGRLLTPEEGCGYTKVKNTRIVGGSDAQIGAWPWIVLLGFEQKKMTLFDCGGSLITSRHVLTAAHCLSEFDDPSAEPKLLKFVRLGEHDLGTDDGAHQDIPIARAVPHEKYDTVNHFNDIAMLYLERDVEFSDRIRPVCLPLEEPLRSRSFIDANPFMAGWGDVDVENTAAQVLQQIQGPVYDNAYCKRLMMRLGAPQARNQINDRVICVWVPGDKGIWSGDSGGPLMLPIHQNGSFPVFQIGVASFTYSFARESGPDIYTKVQYFADWIKEHVALIKT